MCIIPDVPLQDAGPDYDIGGPHAKGSWGPSLSLHSPSLSGPSSPSLSPLLLSPVSSSALSLPSSYLLSIPLFVVKFFFFLVCIMCYRFSVNKDVY